MNSVARDRKFAEAQEALVLTIRTILRAQPADPLTMTFMMVHRTSPTLYREMQTKGAIEAGGGFAIGIGARESGPLDGLPADMIACMISIDGKHKALGLPLDILSAQDPMRPSATPLSDGDNGLNAAAVIRFLWDMDLAESSNPELVARVRAWRQRVEVVRHACAVLAVPPSLDELLWEHGNGAELLRRMTAIPAAPGQRWLKTNFDLFAVILDDPKEG